jgi:type VI secretion system ImpM family protein
MRSPSNLGWFGKLPSYGDYVHASLPEAFRDHWSRWLGRRIFSSRLSLGDKWPRCFLQAPACRFLLSFRVSDTVKWTGIILPSYDSAGRHYPFCCVLPVDGRQEVSLPSESWYGSVESLISEGIAGNLSQEALGAKLLALPITWERLAPGSLADFRPTAAWQTYETSAQPLHALAMVLREDQSLWWINRPADHYRILLCEELPTDDDYLAILTTP